MKFFCNYCFRSIFNKIIKHFFANNLCYDFKTILMFNLFNSNNFTKRIRYINKIFSSLSLRIYLFQILSSILRAGSTFKLIIFDSVSTYAIENFSKTSVSISTVIYSCCSFKIIRIKSMIDERAALNTIYKIQIDSCKGILWRTL